VRGILERFALLPLRQEVGGYERYSREMCFLPLGQEVGVCERYYREIRSYLLVKRYESVRVILEMCSISYLFVRRSGGRSVYLREVSYLFKIDRYATVYLMKMNNFARINLCFLLILIHYMHTRTD
jgi:hypothetical protein